MFVNRIKIIILSTSEFLAFRLSFEAQTFAVYLKSSAINKTPTSFHTLFGVMNDGHVALCLDNVSLNTEASMS